LVRADIVVKYGQEFVKMMADSGCIGVGIGVESGSPTILKNINKGETIETIGQAIKMLKGEGVKVRGFFILGLPGETAETIAETDRFLATSGLDDIDCKIYQPYPGSPIYEHKETYDIQWGEVAPENTFYKGRPGEYYGSVSTSSLTTEQIVEAWKAMETKYRKWEEN
jgi:radical SAM superfamily enzyme YgiQ (UPF0313 family)